MVPSSTHYGVIAHPSRPGVLVVYEPFNQGWRAVEFGSGIPLGVDTALRAAIEADASRHSGNKHQAGP